MWMSVTGRKTNATVTHIAVICLEPMSATVPRGDTAEDIVMVSYQAGEGTGANSTYTDSVNGLGR